MPAPEPIPMADLPAEHEPYWGELMGAVERVVRSGQYILGPEVKAFEAEMADYLGVAHAVGVNSGTDALVLALRAFDVGPGDEVITTAFTFFATAEAISAVGATPVFADIDPITFNLDHEHVAALTTGRTRAILPVHLFGQPADMDGIMTIAAQHGLAVVEDTAQALGSRFGDRRAGAIGRAGAFSFFPSKTLGGLGDGGLVSTDDADVADRVRMLRAHGSRRKYFNEVVGYNSRLDSIQAAVLRVKLARLDAANEVRQRLAARYQAHFEGADGVVAPQTGPGRTHVFNYYTVRALDGRRDAVQKALEAESIATMVYYPVPLHRLPMYESGAPSLPRTEAAADEVLSLPMSPAMSDATVDRVAEAVLQAL